MTMTMAPSLLGKGLGALMGVVASSTVAVLATMLVVGEKAPAKNETVYVTCFLLSVVTCLLLSVLSNLVFGVAGARPPPSASAPLPFAPEKRLCERDCLILEMLNRWGRERSFCVTDPRLDDNPLVYVSAGFSKLTGYDSADIVGKNCRVLQGPKTDEADRRRIREAIRHERDCNVNLLNHKKDGTVFVNEFFLTALRTPENAVAYFVGIQVAVDESKREGRASEGADRLMSLACLAYNFSDD